MKLTVKNAYEFNEAVKYCYLREETGVKNIVDIFDTNEDVIMYGLLNDEIKSIEWRVKNEDDEIVETEENHESYSKYMQLKKIASKLGEKII